MQITYNSLLVQGYIVLVEYTFLSINSSIIGLAQLLVCRGFQCNFSLVLAVLVCVQNVVHIWLHLVSNCLQA